MSAIPHGTASGYTWHRCRCSECRRWKRDVQRVWRSTWRNRIRERAMADIRRAWRSA